jgi:hypothetical protein
MLRQSKIDIALISFFLAMVSYSAYQLFGVKNDVLVKKYTIAEIASTTNQVKEKPLAQINWFETERGTQLEAGDMLFTHDDSKAKIKFFHGPEIELAGNTLFKVGPDPTSSQLERGKVRAYLDKEDQSFDIYLNDETYTLSGNKADLVINNSGTKSSITLLKGSLNLKAKKANKVYQLKEKEKIEITKTAVEVKQVTLSPVAPTDGELIKILTGEGVNLQWVASEKVSLLVSTDDDMSDPIIDKKLESPFALNLDPGTYYWQLKHEEQQSEIQKFKVKHYSAPLIEDDLMEQSIVLNGTNTFELSWEHEEANRFFLEIEKNGSITQKVVNKDYDYFTVKQPGLYRWRVREYDTKKELPATAWAVIEVIAPVRDVKPTLISPVNNHMATLYRVEGNVSDIQLSWTSAELADDYLLELASDPAFDNIIHTHQSKKLTYQYKPEKSSIIYWRITSTMNGKSHLSPVNKLFIKINELKRKLKDGVKIVLKKPGQFVEFAWQEQNLSEENFYQFEVSPDPSFKKDVMVQKTKVSKQKLKMPKPGIYYWRTKIITKDNKEIYLPPTQVIFEKSKPPRAPKVRKKKLKFKLKSYVPSSFSLISVAYARAEKFKITWEELEDVKEYEIEVYADAKMKKKLLSQKTTKPHFYWPYGQAGTFYWRVRAIDFWDQQGEYSALSSFSLVKEQRKRRPLAPKKKIAKKPKPLPKKTIKKRAKSILAKPLDRTYTIGYSPRNINFQQDDNITIEGTALQSFSFGGHYEKYSAQAVFIKGVVFEDQDFTDFNLDLKRKLSIYKYQLEVGLNTHMLSNYTTANARAEKEANSLYYGVLMEKTWSFLTKHEAKVRLSLGTATNYRVEYNFLFKKYKLGLLYDGFSTNDITMTQLGLNAHYSTNF